MVMNPHTQAVALTVVIDSMSDAIVNTMAIWYRLSQAISNIETNMVAQGA